MLSSKTNQEYLDHPAYSTIFILNIVYQICYFLKFTNIANINDLLNSIDKNNALQSLYNISLAIQLIYVNLFLFLLNKIIYSFVGNKKTSFLITNIILFSPAFIISFDLIRSEILSIIFCFLYFIFLERSLKNNINIIISGSFLSLAILAKVQVIFTVFGFLIIFFLKNFNKKKSINYFSLNFIKDNLHKLNIKVFIINIIFLIFISIFLKYFFYKNTDRIFFLIFFFSHFFILNYFKKSKQFFTTPIIQFFFGIIIIIILLKYLHIIGIANSFHPEVIKLISNPISASSMIVTSYKLVDIYGVDFTLKLFKFIMIDYKNINLLNVVFNKLSIICYIIVFPGILVNHIKNQDNKYLLIVLIFIITVLNLIISIRPNIFYLLYSFPFNLILIAILFKKISYKNFLILFVFIIFLLLEFTNINSVLSKKRSREGNINHICQLDQINNPSSYMRYWQRKFDEKFLYNMCKDYFSKK